MPRKSPNPPHQQGPPETKGGERLESWKEIAGYLKREVRTAQRWEKSEGLPVRRHLHAKLDSVYAYPSELDAWLKDRQPPLEQHVAPSVTGRNMLFVLPFDNLSEDPKQEYFSDGLTEEMITQLGRLQPEQLGVIARTTSMAYKHTPKTAAQIGHELGVRYTLEGSVRRGDNRVRITAQLIRVSDQTHLWADSYEGDLQDILALQSRVAQAIAGQIQIKLTGNKQAGLATAPPVNPQAYEDYLRGRFYWNKRTADDLRRGIEYFQRAIQGDPNYALAYAGLADSYGLLGTIPYNLLPPREAMPKAEQAAARALELDDTLAEAHVSLGYVRLEYDWNWPEALKEFERALALNPSYATGHHWYANYLRIMGRLQEAIIEVKEAQKLDPLSLGINAALAESYHFAREYDHVIEQCRKTFELYPGSYMARYWLGRAYGHKGMYQEAINTFEEGKSVAAGSAVMMGALGYSYALAGRTMKAKQALDELIHLSRQRYVPAPYMAGIYIALGQMDQTFEWLEKAYDERSNYLVYIQREPALDSFRSDPRYQNLISRMGLPA
ncbi:MAG TPA: tetratricopeptide repeat protein [Acidobacteriota bacterium]|jgi:TolB-like protein/Tfp pilus assembly protein PilF